MRLQKFMALLLSCIMLCLSFQANCLSVYAEALSAAEPTADSDGCYLIGNAQNYLWFAESVNSGNTSINARLTADIDFGSAAFTAIGTSSNPYSGTFDGLGHTITVNQSGSSDVAPFGRIGNCTIKNIVVKGTINTDEKFAAGIAMQLISGKTANIENCISAVAISSSIDGDGTHGGIIGVADGTANINNCAFIGAMTGSATDSCGGLVGWTSGSSNINNCYVAADFSKISSTNGNTFSRNQNRCEFSNCYYLSELNETPSGAIQKTAEQFASGEVCFLLNKRVTDGTQAWYQTLGTDAYPQLSGKTVYYGSEQGEKVYSNTDISCKSHSYINGICQFCDEYEVPALENGAYQLSNYGELVWFQQYVNVGNTEANAVLTADITANKNLLNEDGSVSDVPAYVWTAIGRSLQYTGTFDGNGNIISGLYSNGEEYCGLFAEMKGTIKNLGIVDSYFGCADGYRVGSFVGWGGYDSVIENCFSDSSVVGSMYCGGIAGDTYGKISNCYYIGKITASSRYSNAISSDYYNKGTLVNCYYSSECSLTSSRAEAKSSEQFSSGEVCYLLNDEVTDGTQAWYQSLSTDAHPLFKGKTVYYVYDSQQGKKIYTNSLGEECSHTFIDGICSICGDYEKPEVSDDNTYLISNIGNYLWFANRINIGHTYNAKLVDDIDFSNTKFISIGIEKYPFSGTFDGCGHTITVNQSGSSDVAPFGTIGDCTIKNIVVKGTINTDERFAAGIAMQLLSGNTANIENCISAVAILSTVDGEGIHGGIIGAARGKAIINNCAFIGAMTGSATDSCGGIIGWILGSSNINNCYVAADFSEIGSAYGNTFSGNPEKVTLSNCYYLSELNETPSGAIQKTAEQFASGEVCFLLNKKVTDGSQVWYQKLGTDSYPKLNGEDDETVYYCYDRSQNKKIYSNTYIACTEHIYENGICLACDSLQEPAFSDGAYQLSNYGGLVWFQQYVDAGNTEANAVLTADITANKNLLNEDGSVSDVPDYKWTPIGYDLLYTGTFDGNRHIISGLYCNDTSYCGLFAEIKGTIKNLGIVDSYFGGSNENHTASFTGLGYSNSVIENCFSDSSVVGSLYCGGLAGETNGKISNCYYMGKITANSMFSNAIVSDYYNKGAVENCFYLESCGLSTTRAVGKTADEFANGDVCYILQSSEDNLVWGQNLSSEGSMPVLTSDEELRVYRVTAVRDDTSSSYYSNSSCTLPADDNGYWIDENGTVLYSPAKITKDTTITFKQFVSVLGDVNLNGKVEKADAAAVLRHISGISLISDEAELLLADVNRDGAVDVRDAAEIIKMAAA